LLVIVLFWAKLYRYDKTFVASHSSTSGNSIQQLLAWVGSRMITNLLS
jgi:hypothetical protein